MGTVRWVTWAALAAGAGWGSVRLVMSPRVSGPIQAAPGAGLAVLVPAVARGMPAAAGTALLLGGVGFTAGWTGACYATFRRQDRAPVRVPAVAPGAPRRRAVIYFTHGEPASYEPGPWVRTLCELADTVPGFPPRPVWPFMLAGIKRSFRAVGSSPHGRIHAVTMQAVRQAVGDDALGWYLAFLDADPTLADATQAAVRDGATDVVFLTVFLTDSDHTAEADTLAGAMGLAESGRGVVRTPALWDDPRLARMVAGKVVRAVGSRPRSTAGVMLVGHGQPTQWDAQHPSETEQEVAFRSSVRSLLLTEGFRPDLVSDAWMDFREPRVPRRVRDLAARGATCVVGAPVTISADSLHSLHDTPRLVRAGARGTGMEVVDVGAWNTEQLLVDLLADRVRSALAQLDDAGAPRHAPA